MMKFHRQASRFSSIWLLTGICTVSMAALLYGVSGQTAQQTTLTAPKAAKPRGKKDLVMPRQTRLLPQFADIQQDPLSLKVEAATEWTELFRRHRGWSGADGIYSVPYDGVQAPGKSLTPKTLFTFGDTIIGNVNPKSLKRGKSRMVHFSDAVLVGSQPLAERIQFGFPKSRPGFQKFKLDVPPLKDYRFWLQDLHVHDGYVYSHAMAVSKLTPDHPWWTRGTVVLKVPLGPDGPQWNACQQSLGTYKYLDDRDALVYFGVAYLENTAEAGWANPDGYIYIYGRYERAMRPFNPWQQRIELAVARVRPDDFEHLDRWEYYTGDSADGGDWSHNIEDVSSLGLGGPELSVTPVEHGPLAGKYLLISKHVRTDLYYRVGESPAGPFGPPRRFYETSEENHYGYPAYTYNAKAHPHLSSANRLLVSYNVNCPEKCLTNGDLYRPRFIWLHLDNSAAPAAAPKPAPIIARQSPANATQR